MFPSALVVCPSTRIVRAMNRGDGLVQRRRVVNNSGGSGGGGGSAGGGGSGHGQDGSNTDLAGHNDKLSGQNFDTDSLSQKDLNCNPTIDEDSDKETRLTLMEEVLLLGLKDKEVRLGAGNNAASFCLIVQSTDVYSVS